MTIDAPRNTWASAARGPGHPAGHGDFSAVQDHPVGHSEARAEQTEREGGVEQDQIDVVLGDATAHVGHGARRREVEDRLGYALDVDAALRSARRRTPLRPGATRP